ncbi:MAG: SH3 domain-containing protein [Candidatus Ventricola sp.]
MKKTLLVTAMLLLCLILPAGASATTMYVKTPKGGAVSVRPEPSTDAGYVAKLPYGASVEVLQNEGTWTAVDWPGWSQPCYIQSRYLVSSYPGSKPAGTQTGASDKGAASIADVDFKSFRLVDPYYVYVQASHVGGYVNLRWAPSMDAAVAQRVNDGSELRVIAEGRGWYQVMDERSGYVGFMRSSFLVRYDDES